MTNNPERDWITLSDDPPGIGHNSRAAGVDAGDRHSDADVAAIVEAYKRVVGNVSRSYLAQAHPANSDLQLAAVETLGATMHLLTYLGAPSEEVAVMQKIMTSIKEVGAGRRIRWLEPSGKQGRTAGIPEEVAVLRAGYAAAMEVIFRRNGRTNATKAAHQVARKVRGNSLALAGTKVGRPHWKAVRDWRSEYSASGGGDDGARDLYRELVKRFEDHPGILEAFLESQHVGFLKDPVAD